MFCAQLILCVQVEGQCDGEYGYIVAVVAITDKSQGLLKDTTGYASYNVTYTCIVLRPFKGEVMDVVVTNVTKVTVRVPRCIPSGILAAIDEILYSIPSDI